MITLSSAFRAFAVLCIASLVSACSSLPGTVERTPSTAMTQTADTRLGQALRQRVAAHPQQSGIHPLQIAPEAFAARIALARLAQRTLDMQYYIWHSDTTGQLLWEAAWEAAERGVRVRMLIDDANTKGLDPILAALDAHPNIEVRLYNPFANRGARLGDFAFDFTRVNHRMHNKSFTADNQAAIVGGRNIGDEYFGANTQVGFQDLDVLAIGAVVQEVSNEFDLFWNSPSAYPAASVIPPSNAGGPAILREGWQKVHQSEEAQRYVDVVQKTALVSQLSQDRVPFEWTTAHVINDDPAKTLSTSDRTEFQLLPHLEQSMGRPERQLDLVSPYFVPGKEGSEGLMALAKRGVKVRVLTNSLSATDVSPVHAGYTRYRKDLLKAGVVLYELKPGAALPSVKDNDDVPRGLPGSGSGTTKAAALHAKTFSKDRNRVFVGSFNLDPRSARLNTEMGMVIDSPVLANGLSTKLDGLLPSEAYEVRLLPDGDSLEWIERGPQGETRYTTEPGSTAMRRGWVDFLRILPIEWML
ncbi:phospholipase D family protein [Variovorax sp. dw_954]|uniref:phospholipase D family protein n=1 Tax=Variovorax sp. dw_954 TaxID=2720078 RepID=UPI0031F6EE38